MFDKSRIKRQIKKIIKEINVIEKKRYRSQAALVEAILSSETPSDEDTDYFNLYTGQITALRDKMHELKAELEKLG